MLGRIRAVKAIRHLLFGVHVLLMGLFLLSFPVRAENKYEPLRVGIPVFCAELKNDPGHIYHIRISPLAKNNPLPTAQTLDLQGGKDGAFEFTISEPGTYGYRIEQTGITPSKKEGASSYVYDNRVYETTVYVVNGDDNNLTASVSVVLANTDEKPDRIIYKNEKKEEKPSDDSDSSEDDSDKSGGDSATGGGGSDRGQMISGDGAAKTGENNHWVIIAYFGACILLTAGAIVYVRIFGKNRRPEDHE